MVYCLAHTIISPLGDGSQANWEAVVANRTAMRLYSDRFESVEPFYASLFEERQDFVSLCVRCAEQVVKEAAIDASARDVVFVLSTTKGDELDLLSPAQAVARCFGNSNAPIVVSNACTSGVCAQITAMRLLESGVYRHAVVIGCDVQSRFIVSGFQSFKALSDEACRPFDAERRGLNLGEAAAAMVWSCDARGEWCLESGSIHNDANHISGPSRTGEGAWRCLADVLAGCEVSDIALLCVHGTATLYNDEMEAIAIHRAGLEGVPICALKGYYGHTMGAAGVLETIVAMKAVEEGTVPAAKGYATCGTTYGMNIAPTNRCVQGGKIIKMLSGFGGTNAAIRLSCG